MTQSSLQTQCPNCQTRFRVTEEQLGIAKGKVRCGNCMNIFNAIEHQVVPASGQASRKPAAQEETASKAPSSDSDSAGAGEEDFVFADNPEEDAAEGPYAGTKLTFSDDELSDSFRSFDERDESNYKDADAHTSNEQVDESWAEAILNDDEPAARKPEPPAKKERDPEPALQRDSRPEPKPEEAPAVESTPSPSAARSGSDGSGASSFDDFVAESGFDIEEPDRSGATFHAEPPFRDLRRDPVSADSGKGSGVRSVVWSVIVLGLVAVLVAQVTWFQFDRLSAIPELRPFYEKACELAGCELKPLINVDAIQSRKLVVRTDPENRSQLVVDAVIINRADFEQPFPAIALTFSNLNGDVVAQSLFTPEEYLAGEGKKLEAMPPDTPVRIAISIRDPGRDAVNYNILFRPHAP